jgi:hypothetical protein
VKNIQILNRVYKIKASKTKHKTDSGFCDPVKGVITIHPVGDTQYRRMVLFHEIAHGYFFETLLDPTTDKAAISDDTIEAFCDLFAIALRDMAENGNITINF